MAVKTEQRMTPDRLAAGDLTGVRTAVEFTVGVPVERMWELVTDVARIGEWSPECTYAAWLDTGRLPRIGARFEGRNRFAHGLVTSVVCVVTEVRPSATFAWAVLTAADDPECPGSYWRYDLASAGTERTRVRQEFVHGPGETGLSAGVRDDPAHAARIVSDRLAQLRDNMTHTLTAIAASA